MTPLNGVSPNQIANYYYQNSKKTGNVNSFEPSSFGTNVVSGENKEKPVDSSLEINAKETDSQKTAAHQARWTGAVVDTTPKIGFLETEQYDQALAFSEGKKVSGYSKPVVAPTKQVTSPYANRGALWEGYDISNCDLNRPEQRSETLGNCLYEIC